MYNEQLLLPAADCEPNFYHPPWGAPALIWPYHDENTNLLGFICRFDTPEGKVILPRTLWSTARAPDGEWLWRGWPAPRPLFRLDLLAAYPNAIVVVCEGEKATCAAQEMLPLPDFVCITSPGGSQAAHKADWSAVSGRKVYIWPDNDEAGRKYAQVVADTLVKKNSVRIMMPPAERWPGWDAFDALVDAVDYARRKNVR
jgi:hypothetical protein